MSEKVKLTREQAEAIKFGIKHHYKDDIVRAHTNVKGWRLVCELKPLRHMPLDRLIKALYIGYEVEETFKVGDWVVNAKGTIGKITNINEFGVFEGFWENTEMFCEKDNFVRHATLEEIAEEKQRRWWAKHGREVWELRKGDILKDKRNGFLYEYQRIVDAFLGKTIRLARFNEGRYDFWKNDVTKHFKVVCFAEDRKDVDGGDIE